MNGWGRIHIENTSGVTWLDTLVTSSSSTTLDNTCIHNCLPRTLGYIRNPYIAHLKLALHKLVAIMLL
jgi:hypothetical protein